MGQFVPSNCFDQNTIVDAPPNAGKMEQSMRSLGYNTYSAVEDILDNSVDARATQIDVVLEGKGNTIEQIIIADNGDGMDREKLIEALKWGSDGQKETSALGKYGMGLTAAALSQGRCLTVITKTSGGELIVGIRDTDLIVERNQFIVSIDKATVTQSNQFREYVSGETGTVVILSKLDNLNNKSKQSVTDYLNVRISHGYRDYIENSRKIRVQKKIVKAWDPLQRDDPRVYTAYEDDIKIVPGDLNSPTVKVTLCLLPVDVIKGLDKKGKEALPWRWGRTFKGFSIVRNSREIDFGSNLCGLFDLRHNLNYIRGEVKFSENADTLLGLTFRKDHIELNQSIKDIIKAELNPFWIDLVRRIVNNEAHSTEKTRELADKNVRRVIEESLPLTEVPQRLAEQRKKQTSNNPPRKRGGSLQNSHQRKNFKRTQTKPAHRVKHVFYDGGALGPLWEPEMDAGQMVLKINREHNFYSKFFSAKDDNVYEAIIALLFSLAQAELNLMRDDEDAMLELFENFRSGASNNCRTYIKGLSLTPGHKP
jgi:hypothetical protein